MNRIDRINDRVTYKPGWKIELRQPLSTPWEVHLTVAGTVPDVTTGLPTTVYGTHRLPRDVFDNLPDDLVYDWIRGWIVEAEMHELDEFFKVDGRHFRDPHPELKAAA